MNNLRLFLFLFLNISLIGGFANARGSINAATSCVDICQMRYTIPVLVLKDTNPVLKIGIKTTSNKRIENISLNLNGTTSLNDIVEITIYGESKEGFIALSKKLASTSKIKKTTIRDEYGRQRFSLSMGVIKIERLCEPFPQIQSQLP